MSAIAIHHGATDDGAWDGPANEARLESGRDEAYYRRAFAWQDPDGDPTKKAAYRFIHHFVAADGTPGAASTRGCSAGIGVLNGGRGGTTIPDADQRGVYNHLAAHLRDADMEPPDLRELGDAEIEQRVTPAIEFRLIEPQGGGPTRIEGYAAVFGTLSEDLGGFREMILPGAFTKTVQEADVRALWQHDPNYVLGRTRSGTLVLSEDGVGLQYTITPPDTQWARDALVTMKRGDVTQSSFAFRTIRDEWKTVEGALQRSLIEVALFDVSPVTYPAYPQTSAHARSRVFELSQQGAPGQGVHPPAEVEAEAQARRMRKLRLLDLAEKE